MSDHSTYDNVLKVEPTASNHNTSSSTSAARINNVTTNSPANESDADQLTPGRRNLRKWLGKTFRVVITDGRVLVGVFNCTDKDANVVLSICAEYLEEGKDARMLGNVMIPGKHIVSIAVDMPKEEVQLDKSVSAMDEVNVSH